MKKQFFIHLCINKDVTFTSTLTRPGLNRQDVTTVSCTISPGGQTGPYLDHHGGVGDVGPPRQGPGPAHQGVRLVIVDGEAPEQGEVIQDLLHGLHLLLQDGQRGAPSLEQQGERCYYVLSPLGVLLNYIL